MAPPTRRLGFGGFQAPNVQPRVADLSPGTRYGEQALASGISAQGAVIQAQDRARQDFSARLDAFTSQVMQTAAQQAQIEGEEFGIMNTPSAALKETANGDFELQIKDDKDVFGDRFSAYGRAARSAALVQMRLELLAQAQIKMSELATRAINPQTGLPEMAPIKLKSAITNLIQTISAAATEISPVLGRKIGAELSVDGQNKWIGYNSKWLSEQQQKNKATAGVFIDGQINGAEAAIVAGDLDQLPVMRRQVAVAAVGANLDAGLALANFDKKIGAQKAVVLMHRATELGLLEVFGDVVNDYTLDDRPYDNQFKALWNSMDAAEKSAAVKTMNDTLAQQSASEVAEERRGDRVESDNIDRLVVEVNSLTPSQLAANPDILPQYLSSLRSLSKEGADIAAALEKSATASPISIVQRLEVRAATGSLTREMVLAAVEEGLSGADVGKYFDLVTTQFTKDPAVLAAEDILKTEYGLPPGAIYTNPGNVIRQAAIDYNRARNKMLSDLARGVDDAGKEVTVNSIREYLDRRFASDDHIAERQRTLAAAHKRVFDGIGKAFAKQEDEALMRSTVEKIINKTGHVWGLVGGTDDKDAAALTTFLVDYKEARALGFSHEELTSGVLAK